jgi:nucleotide-binding universal stress UspA family protein
MKLKLITVTNGSESSWAAIEYALWLAKNMQVSLSLLGVVEQDDAQHPVEEIFGRALAIFKKHQIEYSLLVQNGAAEEIIKSFSSQHKEALFVVGPLGRTQLKRFLVGRSFRNIMAEVKAPILFVPALRLPVKKVLICMGGLGYTLTAEHLGMQIAQLDRASITLMNVIPPIDLDYPEARKLRAEKSNLLESDTLSGRYLREGLQAAQQMGLQAFVKVRHGSVVDEILEEIKSGNYDLVCMGSMYSSQGLRQFFMPNITAEIADTVPCPLLTARFSETEEEI